MQHKRHPFLFYGIRTNQFCHFGKAKLFNSNAVIINTGIFDIIYGKASLASLLISKGCKFESE